MSLSALRNRLCDLTERPRTNDANARFAKHLYNHAASWFLFLVDPTIPATNHRAEQALKTPIVNRKVWGGNRTWVGAVTQQITTSVLDTCRKLKLQTTDFITQVICNCPSPLFASALQR